MITLWQLEGSPVFHTHRDCLLLANWKPKDGEGRNLFQCCDITGLRECEVCARTPPEEWAALRDPA